MGKRFIIYGLSGLCMEVFWNGFWALINGDINMVGYTSIWMLPIYGLAVFLEFVHNRIRHLSIIARGGVYTLLIFFTEFISGGLLKYILGITPWDYSGSPFSIYGLIRLDYTPVWFVVGILFEKLHDKLSEINLLTNN
ncbi:putative ABC transporter permease [Clostridium ganghwense]|uniref:ABC transporter permease n=1 Tax=Clostridium ganghwense TaxID=312089 RepID=A0ABT4CM19_9CLOT|nr:hypothetical protein [Clostridium ganghwense]MCY6369978.1 hypothetical protein [Clostridium ganghwense]